MDKAKVLLIDDNEVIRIYFKEVFWIHGLESQYDLEVAESFDRAESLIRDPKTRPQIIFSDLVLAYRGPDGRMVTSPEAGFSLLQKIKNDPELKNIKVIIFSGYADKAYQDKAKQMGADGYLVKADNMPEDIVAFMQSMSSPATAPA